MTINMPHKGTTENRLLSPAIWGRIPVEAYSVGREDGMFLFDDFFNFGTRNCTPGATDGTWGANDQGAVDRSVETINGGGAHNYGFYGTPGTTNAAGVVLAQTPLEGGVISVTGNDADNDEAILQAGGNIDGGAFAIDEDGIYVLAFETRFRVESITANQMGLFLGLAEGGLCSANGVLDTNTSAMVDKDYIGFHCDQAAPSALDFVYNKAGTTARIPIAGIQTLVAGTWYKVGFLVSPFHNPSERIKVFVDSVENNTKIPQTVVSTYGVSDASFPDDEKMTPTFSAKVGSANAEYAQIDWWAAAAAV